MRLEIRMTLNPYRAHILKRLEELGFSEREAALRVSDSKSALQSITRPNKRPNPTAKTLERAARALEVDVSWFDKILADDTPQPVVMRPMQFRAAKPGRNAVFNIEVRGVAFGSLVEKQRGFRLGPTIGMVQRTEALSALPSVYAMQVKNDSMAPQFYSGALCFVDPDQPVSEGDVAIITTHPHGRDPGQSYIKRIASIDDEAILAQQFSPDAKITYYRKFVASIHRVLPWNEVFGFTGS